MGYPMEIQRSDRSVVQDNVVNRSLTGSKRKRNVHCNDASSSTLKRGRVSESSSVIVACRSEKAIVLQEHYDALNKTGENFVHHVFITKPSSPLDLLKILFLLPPSI